MKTLARSVEDLLATFRTFGPEGPVYQVLRKAGADKVRIRVIESGEELDYLSARALKDPEAD